MTGAEASQIAKLLNNRNHLVRQYTELLGSANEAHFSAQQPIAADIRTKKRPNYLGIFRIFWSGREDSNLRPLGPEPSALPG